MSQLYLGETVPNARAQLIEATVAALAVGRQVLLSGDAFEVLQRLAAADLKELVVISTFADPTAPEGTTANGSPLRMRLDWKERARSKDLVIDLDGTADLASVSRILRKQGIYLTPTENAVTRGLAHQRVLKTHAATAYISGDTTGSLIQVGELTNEGPSIVLAGKAELPAVNLTCLVPGGLQPDPFNSADLAGLEQQLTEAGAVLIEARAQASLVDSLEKQITIHAAQQTAAEDRIKSLETELAELEASYLTVRDQASKQTIEAVRAQRVRDHFNAHTASLEAEVAALRERLLDTEAPAFETQTTVGEISQIRQGYKTVGSSLDQIIHTIVAGWPTGALPPAEDADAIDKWLTEIKATVERTLNTAAQTQAKHAKIGRELAEAKRLTREHAEAYATLKASIRPASNTPKVGKPSKRETSARIKALEAALKTERALRASEQAEVARVREATGAIATETRVLREALATAHQEAGQSRLGYAVKTDEAHRLQAELELLRHRLTEQQMLLATHGRVESMLSESLRAAESRRDTALAERRLLQENLAILRAEFERLQPVEADSKAMRDDRAQRHDTRALQQELADTQRRASQLEDALGRLRAEQQLRASP